MRYLFIVMVFVTGCTVYHGPAPVQHYPVYHRVHHHHTYRQQPRVQREVVYQVIRTGRSHTYQVPRPSYNPPANTPRKARPAGTAVAKTPRAQPEKKQPRKARAASFGATQVQRADPRKKPPRKARAGSRAIARTERADPSKKQPR